MGFQGTIEHTIANANDNASDQVGVNNHIASRLLADRLFHSRFDNLADILVQLRGDTNVDIGYAAQLCEKLFDLARDRSQELEPAVPRENFEKIRHVDRSSIAEYAIQQRFLLF